MDLDNITSPTLLLNKKTAAENLDRMLACAEKHGLHFRPHFKTAQSHAVGRMFRERGVRAITVSSVHMAEYFAADGWDNITIAFPVNIRELEAIDCLANKIKLNLLVVHVEAVHILNKKLKHPVGIFLKIDVGTHRTGLSPADGTAIRGLISAVRLSPKMEFRGFLAHAGHSYSARSKKEIIAVHDSSCHILRKLKKEYSPTCPGLLISTGDSPTCSVAENWAGIDEIRPGNFIFYDLMQSQIGSCQLSDIAVAMACPVVAKHRERQEIIIHGGGIHLSKDSLYVGEYGLGLDLSGKTIYGIPVELNGKEWKMPEPGNYVRSLSQEHGVISCAPPFFDKYKIGDLIGILPVHSCMTVNLADKILSMDGEVM